VFELVLAGLYLSEESHVRVKGFVWCGDDAMRSAMERRMEQQILREEEEAARRARRWSRIREGSRMMQCFFGQLEHPDSVSGDKDEDDYDSSDSDEYYDDPHQVEPDIDWIAEQGDDDENNVLLSDARMDTFFFGRKLGETFVGFFVRCDYNDCDKDDPTIVLVRKMNGQ
jgi:hypothetical protein